MQKLLTLFVFSIFVFTANAQFQKGNKVLGAGLNFQTGSTKSTTASYHSNGSSLNLLLELGYEKKENRINGFFASTGYSKSKNEDISVPANNYNSNNFFSGVGYFLKIYKPLVKDFFIYGQGRGGIYYNKQTGNSVNQNYEQYTASIGFSPGLAYKWNNRFMLELNFADVATIGYSQAENKSTNGKYRNQNFFLNSGLNLGYIRDFGIGARWIIN